MTAGAQRDLIALDRNVQSVDWGEAELVAELLEEHDAAGLVDSHFAVHNSITYMQAEPKGIEALLRDGLTELGNGIALV